MVVMVSTTEKDESPDVGGISDGFPCTMGARTPSPTSRRRGQEYPHGGGTRVPGLGPLSSPSTLVTGTVDTRSVTRGVQRVSSWEVGPVKGGEDGGVWTTHGPCKDP